MAGIWTAVFRPLVSLQHGGRVEGESARDGNLYISLEAARFVSTRQQTGGRGRAWRP